MHRHASLPSPDRRGVHESQTITTSDQAGNVAIRALGVYGSFLVEEVIDSFAVEKDNDGGRAEFQRVDSAVLLAPYFQSEASLLDLEICGSCQDLAEAEHGGAHFRARLVFGTRCKFPRIGSVGGPGGSLLSRLPTFRSLYNPYSRMPPMSNLAIGSGWPGAISRPRTCAIVDAVPGKRFDPGYVIEKLVEVARFSGKKTVWAEERMGVCGKWMSFISTLALCDASRHLDCQVQEGFLRSDLNSMCRSSRTMVMSPSFISLTESAPPS